MINNKNMTHLIKKIAGTLVLVILLSLNGLSQTLNDIQGSFNNYRQSALQEKVFVHTDKGAYLTGEILWFKIYLVDGIQNKPLDMSKVVYVEVLDDAQNPVMQAKIAM